MGTKEKIERAALTLFAEEGVDAISIKRIAEQAGVSQGAMYTHYAAKDDLAWALFSDNYIGIGRELRRRVRKERSFAGKLSAIVSHIYQSFDQDHDLWSYVFFARHTFIRRVTPSMNNPYIVLRTVIADAMKRGEVVNMNVELAASIASGAILQVPDALVLGRVEGPLANHAPTVTAACYRMLTGQRFPTAESRAA